MRATVFVGTSLDGFIARADDQLDFLDAKDEEDEGGGGGEPDAHGFEAFIASVDALVMGRRTYDVVLGFGKWPYGKKPVFVLSSGRPAPAPDGAIVEHLSGTPASVTKALAARGFQHLYVDGGKTIQAFLRAGLIDRIVVTRVPVLIGSGIPLFGPLERDVPLRHLSTRSLPGGAVQSEYQVVRNP